MDINVLIKKYAEKNPLRFHTPGHKGLLDPKDITELEIEGWGRTNSYISVAEKKTAEFYRAKYTHYLISGTTSGILTLLAALPKGRIIIARASHKSLFNGCLISGIEPLIIENEIEEDISLPLSPEAIENALLANPDVEAIFITSPNYYGQSADLARVKEIIGPDRYLIVDGAHGAHFGCHPKFPQNATDFADACVLSAHKTLPALTQSAYLNVNDERLETAVKEVLSLTTTTSPSFLLLAGLEYATEYLEKNSNHFNEIYDAVNKYLPYRMPNDDFTRIVMDLKPYNINGTEADMFLQHHHNIFCEFGNERYVVFIISIVDSIKNIIKLSEGLQDMFKNASALPECDYSTRVPIKTARAVNFIDASRQETEYVDISESEARISAVEAGLFPPCLPVVVRGEIITKEIIEILTRSNTFGLNNGRILVIK